MPPATRSTPSSPRSATTSAACSSGWLFCGSQFWPQCLPKNRSVKLTPPHNPATSRTTACDAVLSSRDEEVRQDQPLSGCLERDEIKFDSLNLRNSLRIHWL